MRIFVGTLMVVSLACSAPSATNEDPITGEQATSSCPATLHATNGSKCSGGLRCNIPIVCDAVNEQVKCECTNGLFVCSDHIGVIPIGSEAICTPRAAADDTPCPPSLAIASGMVCDTTGKLCTYEGPICPESQTGMPSLESCVCRGDSGGGMRYTCYPTKCLGL